MALETTNVMLVKSVVVEWDEKLYNELCMYSYEWREDDSLMVDLWLVGADDEIALPKELEEEFNSCRIQGYTYVALDWK
jgi:hypothetical protein